MSNISTEELRFVLQQLEQAIYNHEQWSKAFERTLICRASHDEHDIAEDAHCHCQFGQWYYNQAPAPLHDMPAFQAIGLEHQHMHQQATRLLLAAAAGKVVTPQEYDLFANALERLRLQIHTLKRELAETLYNRDPLTGANNRTSLLIKLREQHELVRRGVQSCAIVMLDLDHFKTINDTLGHLAGDRVLVAMTRFVIDHLRQYDRLYRYGGEEFVVCLPGSALATAFEITERLRQGIADMDIDVGNSQTVRISASFGLSQIDPDIPVEEALDRADRAMYEAKKAGRNRSRIWDETL